MTSLKIFLMISAFIGFFYAFYCQTKARGHISREKLAKLKDTRLAAKGVMPAKEILSAEGLKYHKGFCIGAGVFIVCVLLTALISYAK